MKCFIKFLFFILVLALYSCNSSEMKSEVDGIPFRSSKDGKWGMLSNKGKVIFEEEFKGCPTVAHNGLFMVKNNEGLWEIYTAEEKTKKIGDEYLSIGDFFADVAPAVKKNGRISLIDKKGKVITTLEKAGKKNISRVHNFEYGYAVFQAGDNFGVINTKGNIVLPPKYMMICPLPGKKFLAIDSKYKDNEINDRVIYILDAKDKITSSIKLSKYEGIGDCSETARFGYIPVLTTVDGKEQWGLIDLKGEVVLKPSSKIMQIGEIRGENIIFNDGTSWGVRNIKDEIVIRPKYSKIIWATDKLLWTLDLDDGHPSWSLVDLEGNTITKDTYLGAGAFIGEVAPVIITDQSWGFVDKKGNEIKDIPDVSEMSSDLADEWIESDYIDFDEIVSNIKITKKSLGKFALNMKSSEVAKVYIENNHKEGQKIEEATPEGIGRRQILSYSKTIEGVTIKYTLAYAPFESIVKGGEFIYSSGEWIRSDLRWSDYKPASLTAIISGYKINGKTNEVFNQAVSIIKSMGKVINESDNKIIVSIGDGNTGYVVSDYGSNVEIILYADNAFKNFLSNSFDSYKTKIDDVISDLTPEDSSDDDMMIDESESSDDLEREYLRRMIEKW